MSGASNTGLVYYGHRFYSPSQGRFLGRDPREEAGGLNLYGFCRNNSINLWDVLGMEPEGEGELGEHKNDSDGKEWVFTRYGWMMVNDGTGEGEYSGVGGPLDLTVYENGVRTGGTMSSSEVDGLAALVRADGGRVIDGPDAPSGRVLTEMVTIGELRTVQLGVAPNSATRAAPYEPPGVLSSIGQGIVGAPEFWRQAIVNPTNAPGGTIITAIEGAGEGIRTYVSFKAEGSINIVPLVGGKYIGPGPVGGGLGGEINVPLNGSLPSVQPNVSGGKFGLSGSAGITFTAPGLSGPQIYNVSLAGGAGPGGAINLSFDRNFIPTNISITIGVGYGFEGSGNMPIPGFGGNGP